MGLDMDVWFRSDTIGAPPSEYEFARPDGQGWTHEYEWRKHSVLDSCLTAPGEGQFRYLTVADLNFAVKVLSAYWAGEMSETLSRKPLQYQEQDMAFLVRAKQVLRSGGQVLYGRVS